MLNRDLMPFYEALRQISERAFDSFTFNYAIAKNMKRLETLNPGKRLNNYVSKTVQVDEYNKLIASRDEEADNLREKYCKRDPDTGEPVFETREGADGNFYIFEGENKELMEKEWAELNERYREPIQKFQSQMSLARETWFSKESGFTPHKILAEKCPDGISAKELLSIQWMIEGLDQEEIEDDIEGITDIE